MTQDMLERGKVGPCQDPTPQRERVTGVPRRSEHHSHHSPLRHQPWTWLGELDFVAELQRGESGKIFHPNSIGSPSILSKALYFR